MQALEEVVADGPAFRRSLAAARTLGALPKLALKLGVRSVRLLPVDDHLGLGLRSYALGYYRTHPCFAPFTHALVDHDGSVYVCCMSRVQLLAASRHLREPA